MAIHAEVAAVESGGGRGAEAVPRHIGQVAAEAVDAGGQRDRHALSAQCEQALDAKFPVPARLHGGRFEARDRMAFAVEVVAPRHPAVPAGVAEVEAIQRQLDFDLRRFRYLGVVFDEALRRRQRGHGLGEAGVRHADQHAAVHGVDDIALGLRCAAGGQQQGRDGETHRALHRGTSRSPRRASMPSVASRFSASARGAASCFSKASSVAVRSSALPSESASAAARPSASNSRP